MVKGFDKRVRRSVLLPVLTVLLTAAGHQAGLAQMPVIVNAEATVPVLKSRSFHFPIQIHPTMQSRTREVCLYMRDGPAPGSWERVASAPPTANKIPCHVPHDGEFSFQLVTVDLQGRPSPAIEEFDKFPPTMTVVVNSGQTRSETVYPLVQCKAEAEPQQGVGGPPRTVFEPPNYPAPTYPARMQDATGSTVNPPVYTTIKTTTQSTSLRVPIAAVGSATRLLNTTRVGIEYNVGKRGTSGLGKIDVWMTKDDGRSWQRIGEESSQRRPIQAEFPGEGVFGIRLVATNGNGVAGKSPAPGEAPTATFEIDLTEPHIHSVEAEPFFQNGTIDIKWKVTDKNMGNDPITIYYGTQRSGPWTKLAEKLKNDGVCHWSLPREGMPTELYFRVEAIDMAGNVSHRDTQTPVLFDQTVPEVDVTGFQPLQTGGK